MSAELYKVSVGRVSAVCFAEDTTEAILKALDVLSDYDGDEVISPEQCTAERISAASVDFNDEVII